MAETLPPLLEIEDLRAHFRTEQGPARAVDGVSLSLPAGRTLAVVGESGCGKTATALSILQLLPPSGEIAGGSIRFEGRELLGLPPRQMRRLRGGDIAMIFQEPGTSLNPVFTIGDQLAEAVRLHRNLRRRHVRDEVLKALAEVRISDAERRIGQYPHELSGGMKQRVMIAMALACRPRLLIADEPTTALDVTIQARILSLLRAAQQERGMAILLITHDLGVVAEMADEVVVMYAGQVVERASVHDLFARPAHPYTQGLLASLPRLDESGAALSSIPGQVPSPLNWPAGCRFRARCPHAADRCHEAPPGIAIGPGHTSACWFAEELIADRSSAAK